MADKHYLKPKLKKHGHLRSVTFSTEEVTDAKAIDDYHAEYTIVHTDDKGNRTVEKRVDYL